MIPSLSTCYNRRSPMLETLRKKLTNRTPSGLECPPEDRASVVMPLYHRDGEEFLILMKRTMSVNAHPGEVSFPGGRFESTDGDLRTTALRECCEEIGVKEKDVQIIGQLDDERTLTGFVITPFAGVIPFPYPFTLSEREVSYLIHLPLRFLVETEPVMERIDYKGEVKEIHALHYKGDRIWGATCRILLKLKQLMDEG